MRLDPERRLEPETLKGLEGAALRFEKAHQSFISEAENIIRSRREPLAALQLLAGLRTSQEASRQGPALALNDVGVWVEKRLFEDPHISAARLLTELGWLKRFATIASTRPGASGGKPKAGGTSKVKVDFKFGERLDELRERRARSPKKAARAKAPEVEGLPTFLKVGFQAWNELVELRSNVRDRLKKARKKAKKKELTIEEKLEAISKDRVLDLRVDDPTWAEKVTNLQVSVKRTAGFLAVIDQDKAVPMWVRLPDGFQEGSTDKVVVPELTLEDPRR